MIYQIRIKGLLDRQWTDWFGGMTVSATDDGDTLLIGPVEDQAALHGLLKKVRDLVLQRFFDRRQEAMDGMRAPQLPDVLTDLKAGRHESAPPDLGKVFGAEIGSPVG
jgi:hypothetical protein